MWLIFVGAVFAFALIGLFITWLVNKVSNSMQKDNYKLEQELKNTKNNQEKKE